MGKRQNDTVTQRGNRRARTFFEDGDYAPYLDLLADAAERHGVEVWSCCLMPDHVHIIAVPRDAGAVGRAFRHVHRHYAGYVNARMRVIGHLWQGSSVLWPWMNSICLPHSAMLRQSRAGAYCR